MKKTILFMLTLIFAASICSQLFAETGGDQSKREVLKKQNALQADSNVPALGRKVRRPARMRKRDRKEAIAGEERLHRRQRNEQIRQMNNQPQIQAISEKMAKEVAKHRKRVARLNRIRQLALEQGETKTVERVDSMLRKENQRHSKKSSKILIKERVPGRRPQLRGDGRRKTEKPPVNGNSAEK